MYFVHLCNGFTYLHLGRDFINLLAHLSTKCSEWAIVTGLCPSCVSACVRKLFHSIDFSSKTTHWIFTKLYRKCDLGCKNQYKWGKMTFWVFFIFWKNNIPETHFWKHFVSRQHSFRLTGFCTTLLSCTFSSYVHQNRGNITITLTTIVWIIYF